MESNNSVCYDEPFKHHSEGEIETGKFSGADDGIAGLRNQVCRDRVQMAASIRPR